MVNQELPKKTVIKKVTRIRRNSKGETVTSTVRQDFEQPHKWFILIAAAVGGALAIFMVQSQRSSQGGGLLEQLLLPFVSLTTKSPKEKQFGSLGPEWDLPAQLDEKILSSTTTSPESILQQEVRKIEAKEKKHYGGTRIVNSYIENTTLLQELANPNLWEACRDGGSRWMDLDHLQDAEDPERNNIWEELAWKIWKDQPEMVNGQGQKPLGLEYWCNVLDPTSPLEWHVDKDETLYTRQDVLVTPTMGAVWYGFPHVLMGGYLELLGFGDQDVWVGWAGREIERIRPEYNRLVYLNVSKWHSVSPIWNGSRYTLAVNVWHERVTAFVKD